MTCYLIAGGGTGGHIFPAVAIGRALLAERPDARIVFVGTKYGMEKDLIPKMGFPLLTLPIRGLLGKGLGKKLALLWRLPASMLLSAFYLLKYRPKAVVGVGGYAAGPMLITAALLRKPTLIQEQNAYPGLTNKLCAKVAKLACLGFPEAAKHFSCPTMVTGNPVRQDFTGREPWGIERKTVLILGGSQGAQALNRELPKWLGAAFQAEDGLELIHQAGKNHVETVRAAYGDQARGVQVVDFIHDIAEVMDRARLIICRAGASTIFELKHVKIPAVLVPFPRATHDHQTHNAKSLADSGAAWLLPEGSLAEKGQEIVALIRDEAALKTMAAAYSQDLPDSAVLCAQAVLALEDGQPVKRILEELQVHVS